jgi:hypothetical protein
MKIERLCIQQQPKTALAPVRVLRVTDYPDCPERDFLSLARPVYDTPEQLLTRVKSFKREFPSGRVQVELPSLEIRPFRATDCVWLFKHPATYHPSL